MATMTRAAIISLSYVRPRLMMWMPSGFRFQTYRVIWKSRFFVPRCVEHASIIWKSFFFCSSEMPDIMTMFSETLRAAGRVATGGSGSAAVLADDAPWAQEGHSHCLTFAT